MQITMTMTVTMAAREVGVVLVTRIIRVYAADRMTMDGACARAETYQLKEFNMYLAGGHELNSLLLVCGVVRFVLSIVKTYMPRIR